ncbi:LysE family translocator [Motilimonas pumila]|uniref:LysE family translocator n=1 Tax=Motilimonas pumila TaxID=2303987 RepID=UPI001E4D926D|nr:LysE family translocator [Motilimonas pumila]
MESLGFFFITSVLLALSPGPDNIFVLTHGAHHGRKAGLMVTLGLCSGLCFHTALVALGVAALLQASPVAFSVLKLIGASYLLYLAWGAWRSSASSLPAQPPLSSRALYIRGVVMNVTNPKVALFFLAYLPQFITPNFGHAGGQTLLLGGVFMLAALLTFSSIACSAGLLAPWLGAAAHRQMWLDRLAALIFVMLAMRLLLGG